MPSPWFTVTREKAQRLAFFGSAVGQEMGADRRQESLSLGKTLKQVFQSMRASDASALKAIAKHKRSVQGLTGMPHASMKRKKRLIKVKNEDYGSKCSFKNGKKLLKSENIDREAILAST